MFAFQLFWMLKLKLCIPPEIEAAAGMTATIDVEGGMSVDAAFEASVEASIDANFPVGSKSGLNEELRANWSPIAVANMEFDVHAAGLTPPTVTAGVDVEMGVEHA